MLRLFFSSVGDIMSIDRNNIRENPVSNNTVTTSVIQFITVVEKTMRSKVMKKPRILKEIIFCLN